MTAPRMECHSSAVLLECEIQTDQWMVVPSLGVLMFHAEKEYCLQKGARRDRFVGGGR